MIRALLHEALACAPFALAVAGIMLMLGFGPDGWRP